MMTSSSEKKSALLAIYAGNSPVPGDAGDLRRHRTHYDVTVMMDDCFGVPVMLFQWRDPERYG